jgi:Domain of unknown function (DUF4350)
MSRRAWAIVVSVIGGLIAFNVLLHVVSRSTRDPGGRRSSSYATQPAGLAAYAELLARFDHDVERIREPLREAALDVGSTVVVLDPEVITARDTEALRTFAERGGHVVAGGTPPHRWLDALAAPGAPEWTAHGPRVVRPRSRIPELAGVGRVITLGHGSWREGGALGTKSRSLLVVRRVGDGRVALLADASPLQNALLDEADNAVFALRLAGDRRVVFAENAHGIGREVGLAAIPARWWWTFGGLALAGFAFILARGRRFGPPELASRPLPPPRGDYVDALALQLARSKRPADAAAAVQDEIRRLLRRGMPPVDGAAVDQALAPVRTTADLVKAVRVLAGLRRSETGP